MKNEEAIRLIAPILKVSIKLSNSRYSLRSARSQSKLNKEFSSAVADLLGALTKDDPRVIVWEGVSELLERRK